MVSKIVGYVFRALILAAGIAMYAGTAHWQRTHHLTPLEVPISLVPGAVTTVIVPVDTSRKYDIVISAETDRFKVEVPPPSVSWKLSDGGDVVAEGNSIHQYLESWGETIEQTLGSFVGRAGHSYTLVVTAQSNTSGLAGANATLKVQIPRGYWVDHALGIAVKEVESYVVALAGLLMIGATFAISKIVSRRHNSRTDASISA